MKRKKSDTVRQVFYDLAIREAEYFDKVKTAPYTLSPSFDRQIQRLSRAQQRWTWQFVKTTKRKVATILIALLLLFSLTLSISAAREAIFSFFVRINEKFISFSVSNIISPDEEPNGIEEIYTFSYLPEGYQIKTYEQSPAYICSIWERNGKEIILEQTFAPSTDMALDGQPTFSDVLLINGSEIYYSYRYETHTFVWLKEHYSFFMHAQSDVELETCIKMVEQMTVREN